MRVSRVREYRTDSILSHPFIYSRKCLSLSPSLSLSACMRVCVRACVRASVLQTCCHFLLDIPSELWEFFDYTEDGVIHNQHNLKCFHYLADDAKQNKNKGANASVLLRPFNHITYSKAYSPYLPCLQWLINDESRGPPYLFLCHASCAAIAALQSLAFSRGATGT